MKLSISNHYFQIALMARFSSLSQRNIGITLKIHL